jgi:hypothetical protein
VWITIRVHAPSKCLAWLTRLDGTAIEGLVMTAAMSGGQFAWRLAVRMLTLCFAGASVAAAAMAADGNRLTWLGDSYPDPFNDGAVIFKAEGAIRSDDAVLRALVRCWTADASLDARFLLVGSRNALSGSLKWQFDRSPEREARWEVHPRGNQLIVPPAAETEFLQMMRRGRTLELRLIDAEGRELHFSMPLDGSAQAIGQVIDACGP